MYSVRFNFILSLCALLMTTNYLKTTNSLVVQEKPEYDDRTSFPKPQRRVVKTKRILSKSDEDNMQENEIMNNARRAAVDKPRFGGQVPVRVSKWNKQYINGSKRTLSARYGSDGLPNPQNMEQSKIKQGPSRQSVSINKLNSHLMFPWTPENNSLVIPQENAEYEDITFILDPERQVSKNLPLKTKVIVSKPKGASIKEIKIMKRPNNTGQELEKSRFVGQDRVPFQSKPLTGRDRIPKNPQLQTMEQSKLEQDKQRQSDSMTNLNSHHMFPWTPDNKPLVTPQRNARNEDITFILDPHDRGPKKPPLQTRVIVTKPNEPNIKDIEINERLSNTGKKFQNSRFGDQDTPQVSLRSKPRASSRQMDPSGQDRVPMNPQLQSMLPSNPQPQNMEQLKIEQSQPSESMKQLNSHLVFPWTPDNNSLVIPQGNAENEDKTLILDPQNQGPENPPIQTIVIGSEPEKIETEKNEHITYINSIPGQEPIEIIMQSRNTNNNIPLPPPEQHNISTHPELSNLVQSKLVQDKPKHNEITTSPSPGVSTDPTFILNLPKRLDKIGRKFSVSKEVDDKIDLPHKMEVIVIINSFNNGNGTDKVKIPAKLLSFLGANDTSSFDYLDSP